MKAYTIISIIDNLFEQLIKNNSAFKNNEGLAFEVKVESQCLGYEPDGQTFHKEWRGTSVTLFQAILVKPHKVFVRTVTPSLYDTKALNGERWENTSNHDSCWRNGCDKLIDIGFQCWDEAYKNCPKEFRPASRDSGVSMRLSFNYFGAVFKTVRIKTKIKDDGYHYELLEVKEISSVLTKKDTEVSNV